MLDQQTRLQILDSVLPNHQSIIEAKKEDELEKIAGSDDEVLRKLKQNEINKRYKTIDKFGNVWLIQNPHIALTEIRNGMSYVVRRKPELAVKAEAARSHANSGNNFFKIQNDKKDYGEFRI